MRIQSDSTFAIDPGYLSDNSDIQVFHKALAVVRSFLSTTALADLAGEELAPGTMDDDAYIRAGVSTLWHPVGTCSIGQDRETSVVDAHLRIHGLRGARVADASVTPYATAGNNHVPTMILAENAASLILEGQ